MREAESHALGEGEAMQQNPRECVGGRKTTEKGLRETQIEWVVVVMMEREERPSPTRLVEKRLSVSGKVGGAPAGLFWLRDVRRTTTARRAA